MILSATQIESVLGCVRAAGLRYIDRIRIPGSSEFSKLLGVRVHEINEAYVKEGKEPDPFETMQKPVTNPRTGITRHEPVYPGQIAMAGFHLLRPRALGWFTEVPVEAVLPSGIPLTGSIDLIVQDPEYGPEEIRDYKTSTSFRYALTDEPARDLPFSEREGPPRLLENIQANIYAHAAQRDILLHWVYLLTKGSPASHSVRVVCTREHNAREIARIDAVAVPWVQIRRKGIPGAQLPPTGLSTGQCDKYLGCPYRGVQCQISEREAIEYGGVNVTDFQQILQQQLENQKALAGTAPPPGASPFGGAPAAPAPSRPAYWIPGDPLNDVQEFAKMKGAPLSKIASYADNPPPPDVAAGYDAPPPAPAPVPVPAPVVEAQVINPPESAGVPAQLEPAAQPEGELDERARLKARAIELGLVDASSKHGAKALAKMIADAEGTSKTPASVPVAAATQAIDYEALADALAKRVVELLSDTIAKGLVK